MLIPFLIWSVIAFLKNGDYSINSFFQIIERPDKYYWFLWILFWINVLYYMAFFIAGKNKMLKIDIILIGLCIVLAGVMLILNPRTWGIQLLAYYFLFFTFGYYIHKCRQFLSSKIILLIVLTIVWFILGWFWSMHDLPTWMPAVPYVPKAALQYLYRGVTAGIAIFVMLNGAHYILNGSSKLNQWMSKFGEVSLGLYVLHLFYLSFIVDISVKMLSGVPIFLVVFFVSIIALLMSYLSIILLLKNKITARLFLGKL